jgi:hypothetical protein
LTFQFSVVAPSATIEDNTLEIVGFELAGAGGIAVFEDVTDASGAFLATKNVSADAFALRLFDSAEFAPQMSVMVQTSIIMGTEGDGDLAALRVLDQRFSQVSILAPASFALFPTGLAGLSFACGGHRLRRNPQLDPT